MTRLGLGGLLLTVGCDTATVQFDLVHLSGRADGSVQLLARRIDAPAEPLVIEAAGVQASSAGFVEQRLVFTVDGVLHELTPDSGDIAVRATGDVIAVSPQGAGNSIVFTGFTGDTADSANDFEIYRLGINEVIPTRLTNEPGVVGAPDVANNDTAYFLSDRSGSTQLWSIGLAGGEPTQVTTTATIFGRPAVSSDGALLCWEDAAAGVLVVADVVGGVAGEPRRLGDGFDGSDPAFASDGRVVFRRFIDADVDTAVAELFVFDPADNTVTQLTSDGAVASAPALAR